MSVATHAEDIHDDTEDDVLDLTEDQEIEDEPEQQEEAPEDEQPQEFVGFEDEQEDAAEETPLVKRLRDKSRQDAKELHAARQQLRDLQRAAPQEEPIVVGARPKMGDFDYDEERFDAAMDAWEQQKTDADKQERAREQLKTRQQEEWGQVTQRYATEKAKLRYPDVETAEKTALEALSGTTQAVIAKHADNPAVLMYWLGKSPAKLTEMVRLDAEGDPIAIAKAMTKMEAMLKTGTTPAKRPPNPERVVRGTTVPAASGDKQLEKLEKEAERTGDRSKIIAHKRALKESGK